jgi:CRAL/TRIO domain
MRLLQQQQQQELLTLPIRLLVILAAAVVVVINIIIMPSSVAAATQVVSSVPVLSSDLELALRKEFQSTATDDEIIRFCKSAETAYAKSKKKNKSVLMEEMAVHRLEEYLDWRQCYGLDYDGQDGGDKDDDMIWKWAVQKAVSAEQESPKHKGMMGGFFGGATTTTTTTTTTDPKTTTQQDIIDTKISGAVDYDAAILKASSQDEDDDNNNNDDDDDQDHSNSEKKDDNDKKAETEDIKTATVKEETSCKVDDAEPLLPQIIFKRTHRKAGDDTDGDVIRDKNGTPILHVLAAKIDRYAGSAETWALAVSLYLEHHFNRSPCSQALGRMKNDDNDNDKSNTTKDHHRMGNVTLLVDLRGGNHWPNPKAIMMLNIIRKIVHDVGTYHPGRITAMIMYPLPRALLGVWNSAKGYFGPDVVESFHLVSGPSKPGSPLPKMELEEFVDGDVLDFTEKCREELDVPK